MVSKKKKKLGWQSDIDNLDQLLLISIPVCSILFCSRLCPSTFSGLCYPFPYCFRNPCCFTMSSLILCNIWHFGLTADHTTCISHSMRLMVNLDCLSCFIQTMCPAHFHFVFVTYSTVSVSVTLVLCLLMELWILTFCLTFIFTIFLSIYLKSLYFFITQYHLIDLMIVWRWSIVK